MCVLMSSHCGAVPEGFLPESQPASALHTFPAAAPGETVQDTKYAASFLSEGGHLPWGDGMGHTWILFTVVWEPCSGVAQAGSSSLLQALSWSAFLVTRRPFPLARN